MVPCGGCPQLEDEEYIMIVRKTEMAEFIVCIQIQEQVSRQQE